MYFINHIGSTKFRTEVSDSNHFMYFREMRGAKNPDGSPWKPPTMAIKTTYEEWLTLATSSQNTSMDQIHHEYFRVSSDMGNQWIFDELPFFKPTPSFFMVEPAMQQGIHCRFGMKGVIAEAHYDGSRNMVAMIGGLRRWILTHPDQCDNLHMYGRRHPSGRHSQVDFSKPNVERFPRFKRAVGNEVILQPGDVLYVPTNWIHYIISLNVNIQCNTRSGINHEYDKDIRDCENKA